MKSKLILLLLLLTCFCQAATIDIGFITDPHDDTTTPAPSQPFGDSPGYRIPGPDYSAVSTAAWIATCNTNSVDIAIHGGDIVNGPASSVAGNDTDRHANFALYVGRMGTLSADLLHAFGHWDVGVDEVTTSDYDDLFDNAKGIGTLQPAGIANPWWPLAATDLSPIAYTYEKNGFRIVVMAGIRGWTGGSTDGQYAAAGATKTQQEWLDDVALVTALPIILIVHEPLILTEEGSGGVPDKRFDDYEDVIASLEALTIKPVVLQGHIHKNENFFTVNGITYINLLGDVWGEDATDTDRFSHSVITVTNTSQVYSSVTVQGFGLQSSNSFDASLVARWKLNEPTGTSDPNSIIDSVAGSNGDPSKAIVSANGPIEQKAINFDADLTITGDDPLILDYPFTFSAWINTTDDPISGDLVPIISLGDFTVSNRSLSLVLIADGLITLWTRGSSKAGFSDIGSVVVNDGTWHHVVGVWTGVADKAIYVDGVLDTAFTDASEVLPVSLVDWGIGEEVELLTADPAFDGDIDDVRVYSVALTGQQILSIYNLGIGRKSTLYGERKVKSLHDRLY